MASLKNTIINDTGYLTLPVGTNAQRPTAANGMLRYNTDIGQLEAYVNGAWVTVTTAYTIEFVLVAGGGAGGGGSNGGGGGGGGGVIINSGTLVTPGTGYSIVIGAGGSAVSGAGVSGTQGGNSTGFGFTAIGGGGGAPNGSYGAAQNNGGSGGGGGRDTLFGDGYAFGTGTVGQGNNGAGAYKGSYGSAGGGGGAGAGGYVGGDDLNARFSPISEGGEGALINWTGTTFYYGPGGGGAFENAGGNPNGNPPGGRGLGDGAGYGGTNSVGPTAGTANRGAGGGGSKSAASGAGGSGRCVIRYYGPQRGSGGTVTSNGGYTIHTFDSSATFTA